MGPSHEHSREIKSSGQMWSCSEGRLHRKGLKGRVPGVRDREVRDIA